MLSVLVSWRPLPRHKQNTFSERIYLLLLTVDLFVEFIGLPRKTNFVSIFSIHEFGCQSFGTIPIESCTIERDWKNNKKQYSLHLACLHSSSSSSSRHPIFRRKFWGTKKICHTLSCPASKCLPIEFPKFEVFNSEFLIFEVSAIKFPNIKT